MKEKEKVDFFTGDEKTTINLDDLDKESADKYGIKITRDKNDRRSSNKTKWYKFPIHMICVLAFLLLGFLFPETYVNDRTVSTWTWSWIIVLLIPMYYGFVSAVIHKNARHFPYPVLVLAVFLAGGILWSQWTILWALFLTVPLYYWLCGGLKLRHFWSTVPYSTICAVIYVVLGLTIEGFWHPGWLIFLTIPIFEGIVSMFKK